MTMYETEAMVECMQNVLDSLEGLYSEYSKTIETYNGCEQIVRRYTNKQAYIKRLMEFIENTDFSVNDGITY